MTSIYKCIRFILSSPERFYLAAGIVVTLVFGTIYVAVQQDLRHSANDPQIQIAEDSARALSGGATLQSVLIPGMIDARLSLAPFIIIYGSSGEPLASSASLSGAIPVPPKGIFDYVKTNGEDIVTWQPNPTTRIAAVIAPFSAGNGTTGYVLAGRSLREVEKRESALAFQAMTGWLASLVVLLALCLWGYKVR